MASQLRLVQRDAQDNLVPVPAPAPQDDHKPIYTFLPVVPNLVDVFSLPFDILSLILASLPLRARLWTTARVCKQWRAASLRSITALRLSYVICYPDLARFPSLMDVCITGLWRGVLTLPATVKRLTLDQVVIPDDSSIVAPPLQHLAFGSIFSSQRFAQSLINSSRLTLTSLSLLAHRVQEFLVHIPNLTSISLRYSIDANENALLCSFLALHATALTSLELMSTFSNGLILRAGMLPQLPNLRELNLLKIRCLTPSDELQKFLSCCSHLEVLKLNRIDPLGYAQTTLPDSVFSVPQLCISASYRTLTSLQTLTSMRSVALWAEVDDLAAASEGFLRCVSELHFTSFYTSVHPEEETYHMLLRTSNLALLVLIYPFAMQLPSGRLSLPHLTTLVLKLSSATWPQFLHTLSIVLSSAPLLSRLDCTLPSNFPDVVHLRQFSDIICKCALHRGRLVLSVHSAYSAVTSQMSNLAKHGWLDYRCGLM